MKIYIDKIILDDETTNNMIIKQYYCCSNIKNSKVIQLNDFNCISEYQKLEKTDFKAKLEHTETSWSEEENNYYYEDIDYCPFCGEKIEIITNKVVDIREEYKKLCSKIDQLEEEYYKEEKYEDKILIEKEQMKYEEILRNVIDGKLDCLKGVELWLSEIKTM